MDLDLPYLLCTNSFWCISTILFFDVELGSK